MNYVTSISTAVSAFVVTNLDDLVLLILFFSQANLQRQQIVVGQYLGFGLLVLVSLSGFLGSLLLPSAWIGLLGLIPLILGLDRLLESPDEDAENKADPALGPSIPSASRLISLLSPQIYGVALLTVANGSDNIAIYLPLLAHCNWLTLGLTLGIFFGLVGVWCYAADWLTHLPVLSDWLSCFGKRAAPYLLIGIGITILWESQTLMDRGLSMIALLISLGYLANASQRLKLTEQD